MFFSKSNVNQFPTPTLRLLSLSEFYLAFWLLSTMQGLPSICKGQFNYDVIVYLLVHQNTRQRRRRSINAWNSEIGLATVIPKSDVKIYPEILKILKLERKPQNFKHKTSQFMLRWLQALILVIADDVSPVRLASNCNKISGYIIEW